MNCKSYSKNSSKKWVAKYYSNDDDHLLSLSSTISSVSEPKQTHIRSFHSPTYYLRSYYVLTIDPDDRPSLLCHLDCHAIPTMSYIQHKHSSTLSILIHLGLNSNPVIASTWKCHWHSVPLELPVDAMLPWRYGWQGHWQFGTDVTCS